jgi:hypothetical protein
MINKNETISSIQRANTIVKSIQNIDALAEIMTSPNEHQQRLSFSTINTTGTLKGNAPQGRTYSKLFSTDKLNWNGKLWFTSDLNFSTIQNTLNFGEDINCLGKTTVIMNNINKKSSLAYFSIMPFVMTQSHPKNFCGHFYQ